jgi:hypothetical protein
MSEDRLAELWAVLDDLPEAEFHRRMNEVCEELPPAVAAFERGAAQDSTGHSDLAIPLYQEALRLGVTGERRRRAVIQMASSLRNLGRPGRAVALLTEERARTSDHLDDAVATTLALALADLGREREGLRLAIEALAPHLPRYQRSMANYARLLTENDEE